LVDEEGVTVAASNSTAGTVLRRLAMGASAAVLAAVLFGAQPAAATATGHGKSVQATAHRHQSDHDKQAAERASRAAKAKAEAARAKAEHAKAEHAKAEHAKAERAAARKQARQQAAAERRASRAADRAAATAAKTQAAITKALRQAALLAGDGNSDSRNGNKSGGQPASTDKPAVLTSSTGQQLAAAAAASKASTAELASTALRQAAAVGSAFTGSSTSGTATRSVPAGKPVKHAATAKHAQPRTTQAAPPVRLIQVQTPIQLAEAGLSIGIGPLLLLGLVVVGGLATVITGTRRRSPGQHS
jgi:hypothetical protein